MDTILDVKQAAQALYGDQSKAHCNTVARQCADGTITHCEKAGAKWYINATREWPRLFGPAGAEEPSAPELPKITADTTIGELFAALAKVAQS